MLLIPRRLRVALAFAAPALALATGMGSPLAAHAYNGNAAASYADTYWSNYNHNYPNLADDCTNFASQALYAGGFPQQGYPGTSDTAWWIQAIDSGTGLYNMTPSWDNAQDLHNFLMYAYQPGGYDYGSYAYSQYGSQMYTWANDGLSTGDLLFYDWQSTGTWTHTDVQTSYGTDPTYPSYYGSLVDQHTSNRYHEIWSLRPTNAYWNTTTIDTVHIY